MGKSYGITKIHEIKEEDVEFFRRWLMGNDDPKGFTFSNKPHLEELTATFIINYLKGAELLPFGKEKELNLEEILLEDVDIIYTLLKKQMDEDTAFSVIYYLQEVLEILPDNIEQCKVCKDLYDADDEGTCISEYTEEEIGLHFDESEYGLYCDCCRPD